MWTTRRISRVRAHAVICAWLALPAWAVGAPIVFQDSTAGSGLEAIKVALGPPQSGAGLAVLDWNGDGILDVIAAGGKSLPLTLYQGLGELKFAAVPPAVSGLGIQQGDQRGVHLADIDNDGDQDLFVANWDVGTKSRLFRNDNGKFIDISDEAGVAPLGTAVCGAWGDYDNDGYLDLFVTRYWGEANLLYHNEGDGTFTLINEQAGLPGGNTDDSTLSFQSVWLDWDRDGDLDLYVMNDRCYQGLSPNQLWENQGDGTFVDNASAWDMDLCLDSMGIGVADYNGDGFLDFFISNVYFGHFFLKGTCAGAVDVTDPTGTVTFEWGWGVQFHDFDYDTRPDLYIATAGYVTGLKPNFLYHNSGDGTFEDITVQAGAGGGQKDTGCVVRGDFDNDGDEDLVMGQLFVNQSVTVLRNVTPSLGWAFKLRLVGTQSNRDAIGAWVQVYAGGKRMVAVRHDSEAFSGENEDRMVFGLADSSVVDRLVVHWPSGIVQVVDDIDVAALTLGRYELVEADEGASAPLPWDEKCGDGIDNDCDGDTDEGFDLGGPCVAGEGACAAEGVWVCDAWMTGVVCDAVPGGPTDEILDGIDNDCDGDTDEPPEGGWPVQCVADELCGDGVDNDCDGSTDEGFDEIGQMCSAGVGQCEAFGLWLCVPGESSLVCDAQPGEEQPEICNGVDDDCDGDADEDFSVGMPCVVTVQDCTYEGTWHCDLAGGSLCEAIPGSLPLDCQGRNPIVADEGPDEPDTVGSDANEGDGSERDAVGDSTDPEDAAGDSADVRGGDVAEDGAALEDSAGDSEPSDSEPSDSAASGDASAADGAVGGDAAGPKPDGGGSADAATSSDGAASGPGATSDAPGGPGGGNGGGPGDGSGGGSGDGGCRASTASAPLWTCFALLAALCAGRRRRRGRR